MVEDEDGFQIPMPISDVVVTLSDHDYSTNNFQKVKQEPSNYADLSSNTMSVKARLNMSDDDDEAIDEPEPADKTVTFKPKREERKGGNFLTCYMAFVPVDKNSNSHTRFDSFFVNDSNYYVRYVCFAAEGSSWNILYEGEAEPNTKVLLAEFSTENLNEINNICWQLISYKRERAFVMKPVINIKMRIDGVKFYKLHAFKENDYFDQPALLYTIVHSDKVEQSLFIDSELLKQQMFQKKENKQPIHADVVDMLNTQKAKSTTDTEIVDLHADSLLETTAGMSSSDILDYQIEVFRKVLAKFQKTKGKRIIFIHGKGEGVLRQSLIHELNYRYKNYSYQDASFQEYGYGATQVTIK